MSFRSCKLTIALICILPLAVSACISGNELQVREHHIVVQEYSGDKTQSTATVSGTAVNTGKWNIREGKISVRFYDYEGNVIGVVTDSRAILQPGERWDFRVELEGEKAWKVGSYSIITGNK